MENWKEYNGIILEILEILIEQSIKESATTGAEFRFLHGRMNLLSKRLENQSEGDLNRSFRDEEESIIVEYSKARAKLESIGEHRDAGYSTLLKRMKRLRQLMDE